MSLNIFELMFSILLGLESEGDIILLVRLQFVSGKLQSMNIASLLELESNWLVLGPQAQPLLVLVPQTQSWFYSWK